MRSALPSWPALFAASNGIEIFIIVRILGLLGSRAKGSGAA